MAGGVKGRPTVAESDSVSFFRVCRCQAGRVSAKSSSWTNTIMLGIQLPGVLDPRKASLLQLPGVLDPPKAALLQLRGGLDPRKAALLQLPGVLDPPKGRSSSALALSCCLVPHTAARTRDTDGL